MKYLSALILLSILACTPMVTRDNFDGSTEIKQAPVSAACSMKEGFHVLGFRWISRTPDVVYLTAGRYGIASIRGVSFNADGVMIEINHPSSEHTDINMERHADWSLRQFTISLADFRTLAHAHDVKMRIDTPNTYTVSSFGPANKGAVVTDKFLPFLNQIDAAL